MKDLLMLIATNPELYLDVFSGSNQLIRRKPAQAVLTHLEELLKIHQKLEVVTFTQKEGVWVRSKQFLIEPEKKEKQENKPEIKPQLSPKLPPMSENNDNVQLILLQNENKWLKNSHDKLERENSDLRVSNEKLRVENNELTVKVATSDKEKELALKHSEIVNAPKGLNGLMEGDNLEKIINGIGQAVMAFKGEVPANANPTAMGSTLSGAKSEVLQFLTEILTHKLTDEQSQKLAFLVKTIVDANQVDDLFQKWTSQTNNVQPA